MGKGKKKGGKGGDSGGTGGDATGKGGGDASDNKPVQSGPQPQPSSSRGQGAGGDGAQQMAAASVQKGHQQQSGQQGRQWKDKKDRGYQQGEGQQQQPPKQQGAWQHGGRQQEQTPQAQQQAQGPRQPGGRQQGQTSQAQQHSQGARQTGGRQEQQPSQTQGQPKHGGRQQEQTPQTQQQAQGRGRQQGQAFQAQQYPQGPPQHGGHQQEQRFQTPQQPQGPRQPWGRQQEQASQAQQYSQGPPQHGGHQQEQRSQTLQQPQGPRQTGGRPEEQRSQPQQQRTHGGAQQQKGHQPQGGGSGTKQQSPRKGDGDKTVAKFTSRAILTLAEQMKEMSILQQKEIVPGKKGRSIVIETNHLSLNLGKLQTAYHFDVQIEPDTPKKFLRPVMEIFRERHFPKYHPAFDGRKNLYSPYELVKKDHPINDEIRIPDGENREKVFKVQVQFANAVDLRPLHNRITTLSPQEAIQVVEIVLRSAPSRMCIQAGRNFFTRPQQILDLGEGMEMYHGFYESVVRGWKPLLNVDVAHKAFPKEINGIDLIIELCSSYRETITPQMLQSNPLSVMQQETLAKFLRTLRIVYEIPGQAGTRREFRVNDIDQSPRNKKFNPDNGPSISIEDYFRTKKRFQLRYPLMPTIWVGNPTRADRILLPAELCTVMPGQALNRKMTENQTAAMIKYSATSTDVRKGKIMTSLQNANHNQDMCIREFGFSIGSNFEKVTARVLNPPSLTYSNNRTINPAKGVWRADRMAFLTAANAQSWGIVSTIGPDQGLSMLADLIHKGSMDCGMNLGPKPTQPELLRRNPTYRDIEAAIGKFKQYNLIFVVIPDSGVVYSQVKKAAELNIGCLTQCIKRKTLRKLNAATVGNILLKVNSKLNGTNHCLSNRPRVMDRPCMIMGADVTHPSPDSRSIPSVAAVTASHDPKAFRYNICCRLQPPRTEIISDLKDITREQLIYFYKENRSQKPERIVFFRDGVSEGQFVDVLRSEVRAIRDACSSLEAGYEPKITFLVVQKRHHTRFFPTNKRDSDDRNFNVPAGTCVDTEITNPQMQDFYLVSHASIQGVAKPTKYCTLWDDNDMSNDEVEELTYHLCHLFTRCNRSVSYPAPTYYAHLAAARAKVYIENELLDLDNLQREQRKINILEIIRKDKPMFFV